MYSILLENSVPTSQNLYFVGCVCCKSTIVTWLYMVVSARMELWTVFQYMYIWYSVNDFLYIYSSVFLIFFEICYTASKSKLKEVNEPPNAICGYTVNTCTR